ncbi:unnamed protein product [Thelazia callipaeda]|uniref:PID domain-containing protein n=1 Tax=Thelazia callipaeda TaxID=103827 RepID=A0A0N5CXD0_THECL|nr:unnamed protein product [Thelazia callipaeda]
MILEKEIEKLSDNYSCFMSAVITIIKDLYLIFVQNGICRFLRCCSVMNISRIVIITTKNDEDFSKIYGAYKMSMKTYISHAGLPNFQYIRQQCGCSGTVQYEQITSMQILFCHAIRRVNCVIGRTERNEVAYVAREPSGQLYRRLCHLFKTKSSSQVQEIESVLENAFHAAALNKPAMAADSKIHLKLIPSNLTTPGGASVNSNLNSKRTQVQQHCHQGTQNFTTPAVMTNTTDVPSNIPSNSDPCKLHSTSILFNRLFGKHRVEIDHNNKENKTAAASTNMAITSNTPNKRQRRPVSAVFSQALHRLSSASIYNKRVCMPSLIMCKAIKLISGCAVILVPGEGLLRLNIAIIFLLIPTSFILHYNSTKKLRVLLLSERLVLKEVQSKTFTELSQFYLFWSLQLQTFKSEKLFSSTDTPRKLERPVSICQALPSCTALPSQDSTSATHLPFITREHIAWVQIKEALQKCKFGAKWIAKDHLIHLFQEEDILRPFRHTQTTPSLRYDKRFDYFNK